MAAAAFAPVSGQVHDLLQRRLERALRERVRYRYVQPNVLIEGSSYRIQSPCCSRKVDPTGGVIDGPMAEADLRVVLAELAGRSLDNELDAWVHSTAELPVLALLAAHGVNVAHEAPPLAQQLGLRVAEAHGALTLKNVLRGGAAEQAGMAAGDEWLAVEHPNGSTWRIHQLDDLLALGLDASPHCSAI